MEPDPEFERFCDELEGLRGHVEPCRPREGLTERIMASIRRDKKKRFHARLAEMVMPVMVASAVIFLWFFFHVPPGHAIP